MGARRLRDWLSQPLADVTAIVERQEAVQTWIGHSSELEQFRTKLAEVRDLERTMGRLSAGSGNARDLQALVVALRQLPRLREILGELCARLREEAGAEGLQGLENRPPSPPPSPPLRG